MSISIRGGKYAPSMKLKPEASFQLNQTNWRPGVDKIVYESTYQTQTSFVKNAEPTIPFPRINKNASDAEAIFGDASVPTSVQYTTESRENFHPSYSIESGSYSKAQPAPGFDRETSNRTNYDLGMPGEQGEYLSTTHAHMKNPLQRPDQPDQPNIGGWMTGPLDGTTGKNSYFKDIETYRNLDRGGGGGEGTLGVDFNIITGEQDNEARGRVLARTGARLSQDRANNHYRYSSGFERDERDIITGKPKQKYETPPQPTAEGLKRPNVPVLATRPW